MLKVPQKCRNIATSVAAISVLCRPMQSRSPTLDEINVTRIRNDDDGHHLDNAELHDDR